MQLEKYLHAFKLRLINLNQSNRSLKLLKTASRRDIDVFDLGQQSDQLASELLQKVIAGKGVHLLNSLSSKQEEKNKLDRALNLIFRELSTIYEESGQYDFFIGYPFVEGRFLEGNPVRCPVCLFPVRLERNLQGRPRWALKVPEGEEPVFNRTFFLAYERYQQQALPASFWDSEPERANSVRAFLNGLYEQLITELALGVDFNAELFTDQLSFFPEVRNAYLQSLGKGLLKFKPFAVMGIFPQSDSAILQDLETLESDAWNLDLEHYWGGTFDQRRGLTGEGFYVSKVDQSQEEAIEKVRSGRPVVIHGPPGTGKTQVILNLVSDAMAQGKRILVCSQKKAALEVLRKRLQEKGLDRFVGLVQDIRGDRGAVFNQIRQQIEDIDQFKVERRDLNVSNWERKLRLEARQADALVGELEALFQALTTPLPCELSPHELYLSLQPTEAAWPEIRSLALNWDLTSLEAFLPKLDQLLEFLPLLQSDYPWKLRRPFHADTSGAQIVENLEKAKDAIQALVSEKAVWECFGDAWFSEAETVRSRLLAWQQVYLDFESGPVSRQWAMSKTRKLTAAWFIRKAGDLRQALNVVEGNKYLKIRQLDKAGMVRELLEDFIAHDKFAAGLFNTSFRQARKGLVALLAAEGHRFEKSMVPELFKELKELESIRAIIDAVNETAIFSHQELPLQEQGFGQIPDQWEQWARLLKSYQDLRVLPFMKLKQKNGTFNQDWFQDRKRLLQAALRLGDQASLVEKLTGPLFKDHEQAPLANFRESPDQALEKIQQLIDSLERDFDALQELDTLLKTLLPAEQALFSCLEPRLSFLEQDAREVFFERIRNEFYWAWLESAEAQQPVLRKVDSASFGKSVEQLGRLLDKRRTQVRDLIYYKLTDSIIERLEYNRLGNMTTYRELNHQVKKKRLRWPLRRIISNFWDAGLDRLVPCWMASPEAVAALFPLQSNFFDLVIFDEASQCHVERGLPVLLRGRVVAVAGDEKQLPPFDLYRARAEETDDEADLALDASSLLGLAESLFEHAWLSWHYRSLYPELINFSNVAFYGGRLKMVPPASPQVSDLPAVKWIRVSGTWSKGANLEEANAAVNLARQLFHSKPEISIGIVSFNFHQQEAIRDAWETSMVKEPFAGNLGPNQFFIKNIENVQGDERDVIIFSVGYAPGSDGKLYTHFGWLNQAGGENRLNVAVTRARKSIYLLCSFEPEMLEVEQSKHEGPKRLKQYLRYARAVSKSDVEGGQPILDQIESGSSRKSFKGPQWKAISLQEQVASGLESKGLEVIRNPHLGGYQLDIAILHPNRPRHFALGIECEGSLYFSGKSAKEREIYRPGLLKQKGWPLYRVWARNFALNPERELERIIAMLPVDLYPPLP